MKLTLLFFGLFLAISSCKLNEPNENIAEEMIKVSKLTKDERIQIFESLGWKKLSYNLLSKGNDKILIDEKDEIDMTVLITKNEELYINYKREFETLGYKFELTYPSLKMMQYNSTKVEGSHLVSIALQQTDNHYQIGIYRKIFSVEKMQTYPKQKTKIKNIESTESKHSNVDETDLEIEDSTPWLGD